MGKGIIKILKIFAVTFIFLMAIFSIQHDVSAADSEVTIYFFWGKGCPHCAKEQEFLDKLEAVDPNLNIERYEVNYDRDNSRMLADLGDELGLEISGVPITIINSRVIYGYQDEDTTGQQISKIVNECRITECKDPVGPLIHKNEEEQMEVVAEDPISEIPADAEGIQKDIPDKIEVPIFGEVEVKNFSLPALTLVIAAIDGFNPCAMWVLLFLISLLLGMKNRKRMWVLGISFIIASSVAYFLFLAAWLNLFLFIGFIFWVRLAIGAVAIGSGILHIRDYWSKRKGCETAVSTERRRKIFDKLKEFSSSQKFLVALGGVILIAFAVNLVELVCSAGLPAVFSNILSLSDLPTWQYYAYLLLYILVFMLDDIIIFVIAMVSLKAVGISKKYSRYSSLIGGIIILILGLLLLFKPEWLMFG